MVSVEAAIAVPELIDMSVPLVPVVPAPPAGGLSFGPKPMFIATSSAAALFAELNFLAQVAIARRVCGP
jgi:hypothetical protein